MVIYKITHIPSGKCYIGQTIRCVKERWMHHCKPSNECIKLARAIQKHGKNSFSVDTIAKYQTLEDLNNAEEYYINWYNSLSPNGYNLHTGGNNHIVSDETRKKQSKSHKGMQTWWIGRKHSKETLIEYSSSRTGSGNGMFGRKHTAETKEKQRRARLGKSPSNKGIKKVKKVSEL
jgi:group I intron endonuclease